MFGLYIISFNIDSLDELLIELSIELSVELSVVLDVILCGLSFDLTIILYYHIKIS